VYWPGRSQVLRQYGLFAQPELPAPTARQCIAPHFDPLDRQSVIVTTAADRNRTNCRSGSGPALARSVSAATGSAASIRWGANGSINGQDLRPK
jgi:hypothetical protein